MIGAVIGAAVAVPASILIDSIAAPLAGEWYATPGEIDSDQGPRSRREGSPPALLTDEVALRRVLVAASTGAVFALLGARYGMSWQLVVTLGYASVFLACSETDLLAHRIPNVIVNPAIVLAFVIGLVAPGANPVHTLLGGAVSGGVFLAMALLPSGGFGDAKLGLFAGLALGLRFATYEVFITTITGGVMAFVFLALSRFSAWKRPIAYGPYIALGSIIVMAAGGTAFERL